MVAGVDFGDAAFAAEVRAGVARIEDLMSTELGKADELMAEAVQHLFQAGGKRFRPLFTVLSAQLGPDSNAWQVTVAGAVAFWYARREFMQRWGGIQEEIQRIEDSERARG